MPPPLCARCSTPLSPAQRICHACGGVVVPPPARRDTAPAPNLTRTLTTPVPSPARTTARLAPIQPSGLYGSFPTGQVQVGIGRDSSNYFVIDHPLVARRHALLAPGPSGWIVQDLGSREGTYINGRHIRHHLLREGDVLQIGPSTAVFTERGFLPVDPQHSDALRIDVIDAAYAVSGHGSVARSLLSHVTLSIMPGQFVAIVGGSGAGKSTLMRLLAGQYTPTRGVVLYNGLDLAVYREAFTRTVGYVPQDDIVHTELGVRQALTFAARLRLPADISSGMRRERVDEVLEAVDLLPQADQPIRTLSGGQRKRVSIAVELLAQPRLLFLDEPTSGLDPGLDKRMMFLLRRLADRGHTVVLVTHTPAHLDLCDNVVFMGTGGHVTFFGPPHLITRFFGQSDLPDVFSSVDSVELAERWEQRYRDSSLFAENVVQRQRAISIKEARRLPWSRPSLRGDDIFRLGIVLAWRQVQILWNDHLNLVLLLLQAPLIALLVAAVSGDHPFQLLIPGQDPGCPPGPHAVCAMSAQRLSFIMACCVIWFGTLNSVRELVKERPIAIREGMVGIPLLSYLGSKLAVLGVLGAIQAPTLLLVIAILRGLPAGGLILPPFTEMAVSLVLAIFAGIALGLLVSAISPSSDRAMSFAPLVLLPQIILSGVLFPLGNAVVLSYLCASRWTAAALGDTAQLYRDSGLDSHDLYGSSGAHLLAQWWSIALLIAVCLGLTYYVQRHRKHI